MSAKRLAIASATAFLLLAGGTSNAQTNMPTCNAPLGWWESKGLMPLFTTPNGPSPTTDCDFHVWSWTAFVNAMQTDPTTGQPAFLSLPTYDDLLSGSALRAAVGPRTLALKPRTQKPKVISSVQQAGSGGVLVDQNGRAVYYATHMDLTYFNFTKMYFGTANYANAAPTLPYPIAATVFKTSWRILASGENPTNVYVTTATIDLLESDGQGGLKPNGQTQANVRVALVGVHVVGVIKDHPEFAWGTFEQLNNAPDLPAGMSPTSPNPVSQQMFTFYKAGTSANESNVLPSALTINTATQQVSPITNVFRQFAYGGATPASRVTDIMQANQNFQTGVKEHSSQINAAFANYKLIGTIWIAPNSLQPGDGNLDTESIGSITLANSTLETFVQGTGTSCFSCHNTSGGPNYPGKDINLSHIILSGLSNANARAIMLRMNP
jgi:hypothetical protein